MSRFRDRLRTLTMPWAKPARFFAAGEMRWALLALLGEAPGNGYQLMQRLSDRCGGGYKPSPGTLYPCLAQMQDEDLILAEEVEGKNAYSLAPSGIQALEEHAEEVEDIWERAEDLREWGMFTHPDAAEVVGPALRLAKSALKTVLKSRGDPMVTDEVRLVLEQARIKVERMRKQRRK